eukprot:m.830857 g.830857  ORF g.830857 m.830857 type:complete len:96 (-) comp23427_c0_seq1:101-388(-)
MHRLPVTSCVLRCKSARQPLVYMHSRGGRVRGQHVGSLMTRALQTCSFIRLQINNTVWLVYVMVVSSFVMRLTGKKPFDTWWPCMTACAEQFGVG